MEALFAAILSMTPFSNSVWMLDLVISTESAFLASVLAGVLDAANVVMTGGKRIPSCVLKVDVCKEADEKTA